MVQMVYTLPLYLAVAYFCLSPVLGRWGARHGSNVGDELQLQLQNLSHIGGLSKEA